MNRATFISDLFIHWDQTSQLKKEIYLRWLDAANPDEKQLSQAFLRIVEGEQYFPTIHKLTKYLKIRISEATLPAAEAWSIVQDVAYKYADRCIVFCNGHIAQAVQSGWPFWINLCSDEMERTEKKFINLYNTYSELPEPPVGNCMIRGTGKILIVGKGSTEKRLAAAMEYYNIQPIEEKKINLEIEIPHYEGERNIKFNQKLMEKKV